MAAQHHIVVLEAVHCAIPPFDLPFPFTYTEHQHTSTDPTEIIAKCHAATIIITSLIPITPAIAAQCPHLQLIAVMATGCGWVDRPWFAQHARISVINCPHSNIPAVTEHALGLYFAVRRNLVALHRAVTTTDEWAQRVTMKHYWPVPPLSTAEERLCIVGYGALGQRFERLARAVGMGEVVVADRKGVPARSVRDGRVAFADALREATVVLVCCPKDASTVGLIGAAELAAMREDAVLINIARGGIVDERALVAALRSGSIAGAATDVFEEEPAVRGESPLLPVGEPVPNLTVSPHVSWYTSRTLLNLQALLKLGVQSWAKGAPVHVVVPGAPPA